ncbi:hypothetical protein J6590_036575 [Homalodisca vitripennis]|nr:hypothetical protein J6590_036575 [Homalodisca vitripennis]
MLVPQVLALPSLIPLQSRTYLFRNLPPSYFTMLIAYLFCTIVISAKKLFPDTSIWFVAWLFITEKSPSPCSQSLTVRIMCFAVSSDLLQSLHSESSFRKPRVFPEVAVSSDQGNHLLNPIPPQPHQI